MEEGVGAAGLPENLRSLVWEAVRVADNAYAPYSGVRVGAVVVAGNGRKYHGVNVENASYGLTVCAERNAVAAMVAAGERRIRIVAIASNTAEPLPPCGACRQVIAEFASEDTIIVSYSARTGKWRIWRLSELLPHAFTVNHLRLKTARGSTPSPGEGRPE